jgi:hypothetical protein
MIAHDNERTFGRNALQLVGIDITCGVVMAQHILRKLFTIQIGRRSIQTVDRPKTQNSQGQSHNGLGYGAPMKVAHQIITRYKFPNILHTKCKDTIFFNTQHIFIFLIIFVEMLAFKKLFIYLPNVFIGINQLKILHNEEDLITW